MKKLMLSLFVALTIASISNAKTSEPLLSRCHVLKRLRAATITRLQELDKKAQEGSLEVAHILNRIRRFCNGDLNQSYLQIEEDFLVNDYVCTSLSEEAYKECKDVFEAEEK